MTLEKVYQKNGPYIFTGLELGKALFISNEGGKIITFEEKEDDDEYEVIHTEPFVPNKNSFKKEYKYISKEKMIEIFQKRELGIFLERDLFKHDIMFYFRDWDHIPIDEVKVCKISAKKYKLYIVSKRPGILIGRAGKTIDGLRDFLMEYYKLDELQIDIIENIDNNYIPFKESDCYLF